MYPKEKFTYGMNLLLFKSAHDLKRRGEKERTKCVLAISFFYLLFLFD